MGRLLEVDYCESVSVGCCRLVGLCRSLWDVCGETVTKGRSLLIGRFVSVGSLSVSLLSVTMDWSLWGGRCELVAVGWSLWVGYCGLVAVGLSRWEDGWMPCVGRCGSIAMSVGCCEYVVVDQLLCQSIAMSMYKKKFSRESQKAGT